MWVVYMLLQSNQAYYTGITNDLSNRLKTHAAGRGSKYVRAHLPFTLVRIEECSTKSEALKRECQIKRLTHQQKKELVNE